MYIVEVKCFYFHFVKRLLLQNANNADCFAAINNEDLVLNLKSVVPFKTRFVQGTRHSADVYE